MFPKKPKQIPAGLWNELLFYSRNMMPDPDRWREMAIRLAAEHGVSEKDLENAGIIPRQPVTTERLVQGK